MERDVDVGYGGFFNTVMSPRTREPGNAMLHLCSRLTGDGTFLLLSFVK